MTRPAAADYLELLAIERDRMLAIDIDHLANPVPHLEGWKVENVIGHTAWLCRFVSLALHATPEDPPNRASVGEPPHGAPVLAWFADGAQRVLSALEMMDPDVIRPTWTGPQPGSWWLRRLMHEVSIHRWDAEAATDINVHPLDPRQASDGIDEVLEVFVPSRLEFDVLAAAGRSIHLNSTDTEGGGWLLDIHDDRIEWRRREHTKADVAVRGSASDLMLLLWGRIAPERVEVFGDENLLRRWQAAASF